MKKILTLAKKEWFNYFSGFTGYIFAGILLVVSNLVFFNTFFVVGQADLSQYWGNFALITALFVPAISMNLIAEERKNNTWEILLSLPIKEKDLVWGKFLGSAAYLLFVIGLSLPVVITVVVLGKIGLGLVFGGLIGLICLTLAYLSLGLFMSSLTNQPIVAFLLSTTTLLVSNLFGQDILLSRLPFFLREIVSQLSLSWRSSRLSTGLIEVSDLFFFFSWIVIFNLLSIISLKSRNK